MDAQIAVDPLLPGLVVLCHGRFHTKHRGPMAVIEALLPFSTLSFDARGMGESEGTTGYSNVQVSLVCVLLSKTDGMRKEEVDDLAVILKHVRLHYPNNTLLALIGHSKGAVVLLTLASQQSIPCKLVRHVTFSVFLLD